MDNVREKILTAAIRKYGPGTQRDKAIEELSELIRALARCDDAENVAEEMADVRIMLDQLEIMFENHDRVRQWEFRKLKRLNERTQALGTTIPDCDPSVFAEGKNHPGNSKGLDRVTRAAAVVGEEDASPAEGGRDGRRCAAPTEGKSLGKHVGKGRREG
jgi:NTP pyrophosphatase (non-canonical NTP hydrolase)